MTNSLILLVEKKSVEIIYLITIQDVCDHEF